MEIHLVDGTYELFRHHMGLPRSVAATSKGAATRGVMRSMLDLIAGGATHLAVATDTVIESFRNELWPRYKTGEGIEPALLDQFPLIEEGLAALGITVWGMTDLEADDALATAAARAAADERVARVVICTPDKDLAQCVRGERVVQLDRRAEVLRDEAGVWQRFGVGPASIPDYLALVGDSADGFPGIAGWGAKSAAVVLARWGSIDAIPDDPGDWDLTIRGAVRLAGSLREGRADAALFRRLATLREDAPGVLDDGVAAIAWRGPGPGLAEFCQRVDAPGLERRASELSPG
jgi:5'-3' exonuclease